MAEVLIQAEIDLFQRIPEWIMTLLFLCAMVSVYEIGYQVGRRSGMQEKTKALLPMIATSILAILGLLLGFTMSMSVSRYEARRELVLEEANAIDTAYLRAQALPPPESTELQGLVRQYAAVRLRVSQSALDVRKLQQGREEAARLHDQMWSRVAALARKDPHSVTVEGLMDSLGNVSDLENSRWIIFVAHVPEGVIYVDALLGLVAALLVGYEFGLTGNRHFLSEALLVLSITMVMIVIVELDRPVSGVVRVSQQPLIDLQNRLAAPSH
jgi:hypothetical protein